MGSLTFKKNFRRLWRDHHHILVSVIMLGISLAGFLLAVWPVGRLIINMFADINENIKQVALLEQKATFLEQLDAEVMRGQLTTLLTAVPAEKSVPSILATVESVAGQTGVTLVSLTIAHPGSTATESAGKQTAETKKLGSSLLPFSVSLSGSADQVHQFLERIVSVRRLLQIKEFDLLNTNTGFLSVNLKANAFYTSLPTELGKADRPISRLTAEEETLLTKIAALPWINPPSVSGTSAPLTGGKADPFSR